MFHEKSLQNKKQYLKIKFFNGKKSKTISHKNNVKGRKEMIICPECKNEVTDFWIPDGDKVQTKYACDKCDKTFFPSEVEEKIENGGMSNTRHDYVIPLLL